MEELDQKEDTDNNNDSKWLNEHINDMIVFGTFVNLNLIYSHYANFEEFLWTRVLWLNVAFWQTNSNNSDQNFLYKLRAFLRIDNPFGGQDTTDFTTRISENSQNLLKIFTENNIRTEIINEAKKHLVDELPDDNENSKFLWLDTFLLFKLEFKCFEIQKSLVYNITQFQLLLIFQIDPNNPTPDDTQRIIDNLDEI